MDEESGSTSDMKLTKSQIIGNPNRFKQRYGQLKSSSAESGAMEDIRSSKDATASSSFNFTYTCGAKQSNEEISSTQLHPLLAEGTDFVDFGQSSSSSTIESQQQNKENSATTRESGDKCNNLKQTYPYPVINSTLRSQNKGTIVFVKIVEENAQQVISNPIRIAKLIANSIFDTKEVKDIRTDRRRATLVIELVNESPELTKKFLSVTSLGTDEIIKVECYLPRNEMFKYGVISPVNVTASTDELMELTKMEEGYPHKMIKMERLKKKTEDGWVDSTAIKVTIAGKELPKAIKIGHCYFRMRPYILEPVQCYKCLRMGHRSGNCTAKIRCLVCGGNHTKNDCTSNYVKCVHCGGSHTANSKDCPIIVEARQIEKIRAYNNESYQEARQQVIRNREQSGDYERLETGSGSQASTVTNGQPSYSSVVQTSSNYRRSTSNHNTKKQYRSQGTQTEKVSDGNLNSTIKKPELDEEFFKNLKKCFIELLEAHIDRESTHKKETMIDNAIANHFKKKIVVQEVIRQSNPVDENSKRQNNTQEKAGQKRTLHTLSDDEGVLSNHTDISEDDEHTFQTVEKRQLLVTKPKKNKTKKKKH